MTYARGSTTIVALAILVAPAFLPLVDARPWPISEAEVLDTACEGNPAGVCGATDDLIYTACSKAVGACEALNSTGELDTDGLLCAVIGELRCALMDAILAQPYEASCNVALGLACPTVNSTTTVLGADDAEKVNAACDQFGFGTCELANSTQGEDGALGPVCILFPQLCVIIRADVDQKINAVCDQYRFGLCEVGNTTAAKALIVATSGTEAPNAACDQFFGVICATFNNTKNTNPCTPLADVCAVRDVALTGDALETLNATCDRFGDGNCETVNATLTSDPCDTLADVCAVRDAAFTGDAMEVFNATCDRFGDGNCETLNATLATDPCDTAGDACAIRDAALTGDPKIAYNATCDRFGDGNCETVNATLATDPCDTVGDVCAVLDAEDAEKVNAACDRIDPADACATANTTLDQTNLVEGTNNLKILYPQPNSWNTTPLVLTFQTGLPGELGFVLQYAEQGSSDWTEFDDPASCVTPAPGDPMQRTCTVEIAHALNGIYGLRLAVANAQTCNANQCATVNGVVNFDTTAPSTTIEGVSPVSFTNEISIPYTLDDDDTNALVQLYYAKDGGAATLSSAVAQDGAFTFAAESDGLYEFWTIGTDAAGNVESDVKDRTPVTFVDTLAVSVADAFATDGGVATLVAEVTQNGVDVPASATVVATYDGIDYPLSFSNGQWSASIGPLTVAEARNDTVQVAAVLGDASGASSGTLVLSPDRLVYLAVGAPDYVKTGSGYTISLLASYADTPNSPAEGLHVVAKDGEGNTLADGYVSNLGKLMLTLPSPAEPGTLGVTLSADSVWQTTPVTMASASLTAVWTDLVGELTEMQHASGWADSGLPFDVTYCVEFAHDESPLVNGIVTVTETASLDVFQGITDDDGCVPVTIYDLDDGEYAFTTNAAATPNVGSEIYGDVPGSLDLVFTKVALSLTTDIPEGNYVNLEDVAGFGLCAEFTYDGSPAEGAVVRLVDQDGATLEEVTAGADGCADAPHVFHDVYEGSVSLDLVSTLQEVTTQVGPTPLDGIVATEVVVGAITVDDDFANHDQTVTYTLPLTWRHDDAALTQAEVTLDGSLCSPVADGAVTCEVVRSGDADTTFSPTLSTDKGVTRIHDAANVATPQTVWTAVEATASVSDALVEVGDAPTVTYSATYTYNDQPVASFTVHLMSACGLDEPVDGADGEATLDVSSDVPCQSPISAVLVTTDEGITIQTVPGLATPNVVWTRITLDPAVDDAIATLNQDVVVDGTAIYSATGGNVPSGTLVVTDDDGVELARIAIVDGAFTGTVTKAADYHGELHFEVVDGFHDVNAIDPVTEPAAWTHVTLTTAAAKTIASVGTPIRISGTASYALGLGDVLTGTIEILDEASNVVATTPIEDGAWATDVTPPGAYNGRLTAHVAASDQGVEGFDEQTANLVWTSIVLTLTPPADLFVNVDDVVTYGVEAAYAYDTSVPVQDADLAAYAEGDSLLGTCTIVAGSCDLELSSSVSYAGVASIEVTREGNGVLAQSAPVVTGDLVWTRLIVQASAPALPVNVGSPADVTVTVRYEHSNALVPNARVTVSGLSPGSQSGFTDATGTAVIHAYETQAGTKALTVTAQDGAQGITALQAPGSASARWTAIGFNGFTYSPAPTLDVNGNPTFPVGTRVTVCSVATPADDAATPLAGAKVLLRGAIRTTDGSGSACLTVVGPSSPGSIKFTAHGVSATIGGASITASSDRSATLYFVN